MAIEYYTALGFIIRNALACLSGRDSAGFQWPNMNTNLQPKGTTNFRRSPYTKTKMDTNSTEAPFTYWLKREQRTNVNS
ncbi:hypothetical protein T265_02711 [Opisthorchis viverrini]|uniref:Uncharacterized protein n=1 Tax=Opisthorchis viverrini TaxID=6198 RepID=A0A075A5K0_OPIVI|nr:hypothetical protein T265_02711 [Opisthorchis viverrini]KER30895.1 hypothetical protein T265_02711 [Opisthorchis viverrini]